MKDSPPTLSSSPPQQSTTAATLPIPPLIVFVSRMIRRQQWLSAEAPDDSNAPDGALPAPAPPQASAADKYGIDLSEFKMKSGRKPKGWKKAMRIAEWTGDGQFRTGRNGPRAWPGPAPCPQDPYRRDAFVARVVVFGAGVICSLFTGAGGAETVWVVC